MRGRVILSCWFLFFSFYFLIFQFCECQSIKSKIGRNPAGIDWIFVKGSTFQMGDVFFDEYEDDAEPVHMVAVGDYYLSKCEITVVQYRAFCKATDRSMPEAPRWGWMEKNPIVNVSWNDAEAFCEWAGGRLPTEAEWEYAAKGGRQSNGYRYSGSNTIDEVAWYIDNSGLQTHMVGTKKSNELGLYDMSGNVWEWCSDWHREMKLARVLRGGSWFNDRPGYGRALYNYGYDPDYWHSGIGFRCAKSVNP